MYLSVGGTRTGEAPRAQRDGPTGRELILKLTCWVRGTHPSTLGRTRARTHQLGEPKETETEVEYVFGRGLVGMYLSTRAQGCLAGEFADRNVFGLLFPEVGEEVLLGVFELH